MTPQVTTLDNGVTIASDPMDTVETVSVGAWVGVGTRHEPDEINGIAHLLEHMVFKGTARRSAYDIAAEIEAVGGHLNAYTAREHTAYYAKVLKEDLALACDLIADLVRHPTLDATELDRERHVILQEIYQAEDTPDDIIFDHFQATAYPKQPMGLPVLGTAESIATIDQATLKRFIDEHYVGARTVIAASGRLEHDHLVELVAEAFADLPKGHVNGETKASYVGGDFRGERPLEQMHVLLGFEGLSFADGDFYAASVLSTLFGGGMSSRLFQEVREKRGLVYAIQSFLSCYDDGGTFGIYAGTGSEQVGELMPLICDEISSVAKTASDEETARAAAQLKASILMGRESTSGRAEQLARQIMIFGRPLTTDEVVTGIEAVDAAAVKRVAKRMFSSAPTLAALGPAAGMRGFDRQEARIA